MLWVKAFHIVFVASWFAGLFYLPRIFVNLAMVEPGSLAERQRLLLMAHKLYRFTTMLAVPALGLGLWLWEKHNVWGLFGAVAVASLLALLLLRKFNFREIPKEHITPFRQESFRNLLYEKNVLPASILEAIIALGSGAISPYLILFLIQRGVMNRPGLFYTFQCYFQ